jgi:hypothetical protein
MRAGTKPPKNAIESNGKKKICTTQATAVLSAIMRTANPAGIFWRFR